jgi:AraC-like DNA-binding protein
MISIQKGYGCCFVDNEYYPLIAGSLVLLAPDSVVQLEDNHHLLGKVMIFREDYLSIDHSSKTLLYKILYGLGNDTVWQLGANETIAEFVDAKLQMCAFEYVFARKDSIDNNIMFNHLSSIFLLIHKLQLIKREQCYTIDKLNESKYNLFIELVNSNYKKQHHLDFYVLEMDISNITLNEVCSDFCGCEAEKIIQCKLITEAKRLLMFDSRSVSDIGLNLGFQEFTSFDKFFKDKTSMSVSEFRTTNSSGN